MACNFMAISTLFHSFGADEGGFMKAVCKGPSFIVIKIIMLGCPWGWDLGGGVLCKSQSFARYFSVQSNSFLAHLSRRLRGSL